MIERRLLENDRAAWRIEKREKCENKELCFELEQGDEIQLSLIDKSSGGLGAFYRGSNPPAQGSRLVRRYKNRMVKYQSRWHKLVGDSLYQLGLKKETRVDLMPGAWPAFS